MPRCAHATRPPAEIVTGLTAWHSASIRAVDSISPRRRASAPLCLRGLWTRVNALMRLAGSSAECCLPRRRSYNLDCRAQTNSQEVEMMRLVLLAATAAVLGALPAQ